MLLSPASWPELFSLQATRATNGTVAVVEPRMMMMARRPWRITLRKWRTLLWKMVCLSMMTVAPPKRRKKTPPVTPTCEVTGIFTRIFWNFTWTKECWKWGVRMILFHKMFRISLFKIMPNISAWQSQQLGLKSPQNTTNKQIFWTSVSFVVE